MVSTSELIKWQDERHTNLSIYAINQFLKTAHSSPAVIVSSEKERILLAWVIKDGHMWGIHSEDDILSIVHCGRDIEKVRWHTSLNDNNHYECQYPDEVWDQIIEACDNHATPRVVILDEDTKPMKALSWAVSLSSSYVDFISFDNLIQITGYTSSNRKVLFCAKYHHFICKNQSFQKMTSDLLLTRIGTIQKLYYNHNIPESLDNHGPTQMMANNIIDNNINDTPFRCFDISKSYSSAVCRNRYNYPIH